MRVGVLIKNCKESDCDVHPSRCVINALRCPPQTSLSQFAELFERSIDEAEKSVLPAKRVAHILGVIRRAGGCEVWCALARIFVIIPRQGATQTRDHPSFSKTPPCADKLTWNAFTYVSRGLYQDHRAMFGLALASTILISGGRASAEELGLLQGSSVPVEDLPPKPKVGMRGRSMQGWTGIFDNERYLSMTSPFRTRRTGSRRWCGSSCAGCSACGACRASERSLPSTARRGRPGRRPRRPRRCRCRAWRSWPRRCSGCSWSGRCAPSARCSRWSAASGPYWGRSFCCRSSRSWARSSQSPSPAHPSST